MYGLTNEVVVMNIKAFISNYKFSCIVLSFILTLIISNSYANGNQIKANSPIDFTGLVLWLDANDSATLFSNSACTTAITTDADVACWHDKSGLGNHVIQTTAAMPNYRLNQQNGMPALEFVDGAGNDGRLATTTAGQITANGSYTKFVVFSYDNLTSINNLISSDVSGTAFWGSSGANSGRLHTWHLGGTASNPGFMSLNNQLNINQYYIGATRYDNVANDGNLSILNIDGIEVDNDDSVQTHASQIIVIGNHSNTFGLDGRIAEAIVYNRALTNIEIDCVEAYLGEKWSITTANAGAQCAGSSSITLTKSNYPEFKIFQRDNNNHYDFTLEGSFVGTCTAVEASFNGSTFSVIDSAPVVGTFSGTLSSQSVGQGDLSVRCANNNALIDSVNNIGIGDVYVVAGQSNAEGRGDNIQLFSTVAPTATIFPTVYSQDDVWFLGNDDTDPDGRNGSVWPIVGGYIVENTSIPVAFITAATGSTALVNPPEWSKGGIVCENNTVNCFDDMVNQVNQSGVNAVKAILWYQGESDAFAAPATTRVEYLNALNQFISDAQSDLPGTPDLVAGVIGTWIANPAPATEIRLATMDSWNSNASILHGPQGYDIHISNDGVFDDFHYAADDELQTMGFRWWKALEEHYYAGTQGRGPVINATSAMVGSNEILLDFTASSALSPLAGLSTSVWQVDDNGTNITVTNASIIDVDTIRLTLENTLTSQTVLVSYARNNTGENQMVLTDSTIGNTGQGVSPLPADPFSNYSVNVSAGLVDPNLTVSLSNCVSKLSLNQNFIYELSFENSGGSDINGAIIQSQFSTLLTAIQWSCEGYNGAICPAVTGSGDISEISNLPIGSSLVYLVNASVNASLLDTIDSTATINLPSGIVDTDNSDNFAQDVDHVFDIVFLDGFECTPPGVPSTVVHVHEDAEDGNTDNWATYGITAGSTISNVLDNGGHAIELNGNNGLDNGFSYTNLNIQSGFIASWQLKYSNAFRFFAIIHTTNSPNNNIYLEYTPDDISTGLSGAFIHHGLGTNVNDGTWHTFTRDLEADLHATLPNDTLTEIVGFSIRGSGRIDNILTYARQGQANFSYSGHNYEIVKTAMNWHNAKSFANNKGGYLANIENIAENHEIYSRLYRFIPPSEYSSTVSPGGGSASYVWIGANDLNTPDSWVWDNNSVQFWLGKVFGNSVGGLYNNWGKDTNENPHEPDDAGMQQSAGIALTHWPVNSGSLGQTSQWNDLISVEPLYFIIEYD